MKLSEMTKVMQHHKDGNTVEFAEKGNDDWEIVDFPLWNWADYNYRIKEPEQKQKVTIEKWLMQSTIDDEYRILETSLVDTIVGFKKVKLIKSYEVEL